METYRNCRTEVIFYDERTADERENTDVRVSSSDLILSYEVDGEPRIWRGSDLGGGHFDLRCNSNQGRSLMHRCSNILEGYWQEEGDRGFWRIHLEEGERVA